MKFSIVVPDPLRAKDFYHDVFGWTYTGDQIDGASPEGAIVRGDEPHIAFAYGVTSLAQSVATVRELGGVAPDDGQGCTDGRGAVFDLWQPEHELGEFKGAVGDLFYFVVQAPEAATKDFFAELLGWEYSPGSHKDGWNITNVSPPGGMMIGTSGRAQVYFHVADVPATLAKVRAKGGVAGEPQPNQAGEHATCRDDQGVTFGIGSLR